MSKFAFQVSRDSKGFEDIESFWKASDAVVEPIDSASSDDEFVYDTSSSISVSEDESTLDQPTEKEISLSPSRTMSEESSLSLPDNSSIMTEEQDTDAQESDAHEIEKNKTKPPLNPARRASAPGAISLPSKSNNNKTTPLRVEAKIASNSPFDAGRLSIIGGAENPILPSPPGNSTNNFEAESNSPDFGDNGNFDDDDDPPFNYDEPISPKTTQPKATPLQSVLETKSSLSSLKKSPKQHTPKKTVRHSIIPESDEEAESPPTSTTKNRRISFASTIMDTPGSDEFPVGRQIDDDSYDEQDGDTTMDLDTSAYSTSKEYVDTSYLRASKKGVFESDDELSVDHEDEDDEDDAESMGIRRSRRKTKGKRLQFWKNERSVYMNGKMMGLLIADPTPAKPKRKRVDTSKTSENNKKKKSTLSQLSKKLHTESESDKESEVPPSIPKKYKYIDRMTKEGPCTFQVLNQEENEVDVMKIVCPVETLYPPSSLPISALRPPGKEGVGLASQSFNVESTPTLSGWISGFMELPAEAIKDAECVGDACQVFVVAKCQNGALEYGLGDPEEDDWNDQSAQRTLLNSGDFFYVPPGNIYRLENHSKTTSALIYWTIIRPVADKSN